MFLIGYIFLYSIAFSIIEIFPFYTYFFNSVNSMALMSTSAVVVIAMYYLTLPVSKDDIAYQKEEGNVEGGTTTFEPDVEMPEETNNESGSSSDDDDDSQKPRARNARKE